MLNDVDQDETARETPTDADALFSRLKRQVKADYNSKSQVNWRREAREDFDFDAGDQLNEEDKAILQDAKRPIVIFNRLGTTVASVAGQEVGNRQEVQFLPRRLGVAKKNELPTSAAKWFRQQRDAEDEESDAFRDLVVCEWVGRKPVWTMRTTRKAIPRLIESTRRKWFGIAGLGRAGRKPRGRHRKQERCRLSARFMPEPL